MIEYIKTFKITSEGIYRVCENILKTEARMARVIQAVKINESVKDKADISKFKRHMAEVNVQISNDIPAARKLIGEALIELKLINDALNERLPKDKQVSFSDLIEM